MARGRRQRDENVRRATDPFGVAGGPTVLDPPGTEPDVSDSGPSAPFESDAIDPIADRRPGPKEDAPEPPGPAARVPRAGDLVLDINWNDEAVGPVDQGHPIASDAERAAFVARMVFPDGRRPEPREIGAISRRRRGLVVAHRSGHVFGVRFPS